MHLKKKTQPQEKPKLHPRNRHRERYDLKCLVTACPELASFVTLNVHGGETIDFANPEAVKLLNKALLIQHYDMMYWDIPPGYLCPPVPGRADYLHNMADLLGSYNFGNIPTGEKITCLDVGVGANCIYPVIGTKECRLQTNPTDLFYGIIQKDEYIDFTVCNPPFHASMAAATAGTLRKLSNLNEKKIKAPVLNFGGQNGELWCEGGEAQFVGNMIRQSRQFATSVFWFSTLVSKQSHLKGACDALAKAAAVTIKTIPMGQGNKTSRVLAWTFLTKEQQKAWRDLRWKGGAA